MEDRLMTLPQVNGENSLYQSATTYYGVATAGGKWHGGVWPAANTCTCTSPDCRWSCPSPPDPCAGLTGCALSRCVCRQDDTCRVVSDPHPPCFFRCKCL